MRSCGVSAVRVREVGATSNRSPGLSPADPAVRCRLDTASAPPTAASRGVPRLRHRRWSRPRQPRRRGCQAASPARGPRRAGGRGGHGASRPWRRQIGADRGHDGDCGQREQHPAPRPSAAHGCRRVGITGPAPTSRTRPGAALQIRRPVNGTADGHRGRRSFGRRLGFRAARRR